MDFGDISAEIERKRKAKESLTGGSKKYVRRGDLEAARSEAEQASKRDELAKREAKLWHAAKQAAGTEEKLGGSLKPDVTSDLATPADSASLIVQDEKPEAFNVSDEEAVRRLRSKGQPIRLFAESNRERRLRLRALELIEERTEGQQNDLMRAMEGVDQSLLANPTITTNPTTVGKTAADRIKADAIASGGTSPVGTPGASSPAGSAVAAVEDDNVKRTEEGDIIIDLALLKTDPRKLYPHIYFALKKVLKEWEASMAERPESVRRSTQGKLAAATQKQSAEYLKPLFKALRKRELEPDVLSAIAEIVHNMQVREYLRANDAYLRLSIGNAPWPIGVTMVGIHERSAREKIFSNSVAHVLNDEVSRKYIQSLKRLLSFAQIKRPPADLSQMMG
ncbi:hypothetical protein E5Q_02708 [Mixia osmundae IAM 14324]|uniref:Pre-mRNA-splicing factor 18 n=1 Tax=Mixia osmundae (strain CBS 9802 / IAM 14324 / JCM 22182 / KY 12970) TaxID=764103 RepID=G7DZN7_MIXOS|nr:hypothetical protein E5Q_02708 [Mixia osmundae IAM 14324]